MHGRRGPHTPTNGLAASPGSRGTQANPSQHVYCRHGRPNQHLPVPWGRRTSGTAGRQSWATETARYGAPCGGRDPRPLTTPVIGQVGSGGIHNNPPSRVYPPRSIATHHKNPRSEVANLAENGPKSGAREWSRVWCTAVDDHTHRQMALQCPQGPGAHRQTRPNMCAAALADPSTFPCHGEGELSGRPVAKISGH